jgi:hypothetical protein
VDFTCTVTKGQLRPEDAPRWAAYLSRLDGKKVTVQVKKPIIRRTTDQNSWYWASVVPTVAVFLSEATGKLIDKGDAHYVLKSTFLGNEETPLGAVPRSTTTLSIEEFADYCTRIQAHAASEWGLVIPGPEGGGHD